MYGFPHTRQIGRFSKTRISRIIRRSDYFTKITEDSAFESKVRQAILLRLVRGRYFYLVGVQSDAEIQSESVDLIIRDEFDLMDQDNAFLLLQRNSASIRKMFLDLGFPLIEGSGINQQFVESDQREYEVCCLKCGTWQEITWPRNVDRERMERVCWKCHASLEQPLRNYRWGRWVARNPGLSEVRHGYHVSKLIYPGLDFADFIKAADNQIRAMEFSVFYLGLPFTSRTMRITEGLFMACVDPMAKIENVYEQRAKLSAKNETAKAIDYSLKRWPALTRFLDDGRLCMSNNAAERALRGIAVGRHNWTFAGSDAGGERAAAIYTLIETAKLNDVDPRAWLADVLARLPDHPAKRIAELLPWNWRTAQHSRAAA